jgi:phosphoribosylaminoimidazole-succinocarboxamide synthase
MKYDKKLEFSLQKSSHFRMVDEAEPGGVRITTAKHDGCRFFKMVTSHAEFGKFNLLFLTLVMA